MAMIRPVISGRGGAAMLCRNGTFGVRIMCTIRVWVSRPTTNQPDWNRPWSAGVRASNTYHIRSEEHTSELQSQSNLVCRLLLEKKKIQAANHASAPGLGRARQVEP